MTDAAERHELVRLNLSAGIKAKQSSAYDAALGYLRIGHDLLGTDAWHQAYDLAWTLNNELQHCYYLTGDWTNADAWTELLLDQARTAVEKGIVLANRTRQYATTGRMQESIEAGMSIRELADHVFRAIKDEQLYVITHPEYLPLIQKRFENILQQKNPS